jgi:hypothetical protein
MPGAQAARARANEAGGSSLWRLAAAAGGLLALFPAARAQPLPPPGAGDPGLFVVTRPGDAPTSWGCNAASLTSGEKCVFEGSSKPTLSAEKQGAANFAAAAALAPEACARAAATSGDRKAPAELRDLCLKDFKKAASAECKLGGAALLDDKGRFSAEAKACYLALGEILRTVNRMATTASDCCRCALAAKCVGSAHACYRFLAEDPPVLPRCAATDCREDCGHLLPGPARAPDAGVGAAAEPAHDPAGLEKADKADEKGDAEEGPRHPPHRSPKSR